MTGIVFYIFSLFLSYSDCKSFTIPNVLIFTMFLMMTVFGVFESKIVFSSVVLSLLVLIFFILLLLIKPTMILGGGDIKYMMIVALYLGIFKFAFFLILTGILQTIFLVYKKRIRKRKIAPMVPIMFLSVILVEILKLFNIHPLLNF